MVDTFSDGQINSVLETDTGQVSVAGGGVKFAQGGLTPGTANKVSDIGNMNMGLFMDALGVQVIQGVNNKKVIMTEATVTETQNIVSITEANAELFI